MASRYWRLYEHMGYAGTDSEEYIDLCEWWGMSPEEVEEMDEGFVEAKLSDESFQNAIERVDAGALSCTKEDYKRNKRYWENTNK